MFNKDETLTNEILFRILDIVQALKGANFDNERAFLLNKISEFHFQRLFDEIMEEEDDVNDQVLYLVGNIIRNLQNI